MANGVEHVGIRSSSQPTVLKYQNGLLSPSAADEHRDYAPIRPEGARQGLSSRRLGAGCAVSCVRSIIPARSEAEGRLMGWRLSLVTFFGVQRK